MIPLADNCSGLSDCAFEVRVALAVVAIFLVIALAAMLWPAFVVAVRAALGFGRMRAAVRALEAAGERGFLSYRRFKRAMGPAGKGMEWHHLVEQTASNVARFGAEAIHNTGNLVRIEVRLHRIISRYYSQKRPFTGGQTTRAWLRNRSYEYQLRFGRRIWRKVMRR